MVTHKFLLVRLLNKTALVANNNKSVFYCIFLFTSLLNPFELSLKGFMLEIFSFTGF